MSEPRFVKCLWLDAWSNSVDDVSIEKAHEDHEALEMESRGWLIIDNETGVSIFSERAADRSTYRSRTFIPRGMVMSIEDFPPKRKKRPKPTTQPKNESPSI